MAEKQSIASSTENMIGQEHTMLNDQSDVQAAELRLVELLNNFKAGKLNAFDEACSLEKMNSIKEQQEKLAQLHFELEEQETEKMALSEEERARMNREMMDKLMSNMETLCSSIQSLGKNEGVE